MQFYEFSRNNVVEYLVNIVLKFAHFAKSVSVHSVSVHENPIFLIC